ncbi:hypothetical protein TNCV_671371 [Trichonephila clavipes]|nr:hypothetical protein TNCV_671371 [Trichonephila clavipes]
MPLHQRGWTSACWSTEGTQKKYQKRHSPIRFLGSRSLEVTDSTDDQLFYFLSIIHRWFLKHDNASNNNHNFVNVTVLDANAVKNFKSQLVDKYLQLEDIQRLDWTAMFPDRNPIGYVCDVLGRSIVARRPALMTIDEL